MSSTPALELRGLTKNYGGKLTALMGVYLWRTHPMLGSVLGSGIRSDELSESDRARLGG